MNRQFVFALAARGCLSEEPVLRCVLNLDMAGCSTPTRFGRFATGCVNSVYLFQIDAPRCVGQSEPVNSSVAFAICSLAGCWGRGNIGDLLRLEKADRTKVESWYASCVKDVVAEDRYRGILNGGKVEGD